METKGPHRLVRALVGRYRILRWSLLRLGLSGAAAKHGCYINKQDEGGRGEIVPLGTKGDNIAAVLLRLGQSGVMSTSGLHLPYFCDFSGRYLEKTEKMRTFAAHFSAIQKNRGEAESLRLIPSNGKFSNQYLMSGPSRAWTYDPRIMSPLLWTTELWDRLRRASVRYGFRIFAARR